MKSELQIVEEFQSSNFGQMSIREAVFIAHDVMKKKKFVYIFKKVRNFDEQANKRIFREGWITTPDDPSYYSTIGSVDVARPVGAFMETLYSKQGERKRPTRPNTRFWSLWYTFNLMFGDAGLVITDSRVQVTDKDHMYKLIRRWENILSKADGRPMITVLGEYTMAEMDKLENMSDVDLDTEIYKLKGLLDVNSPYTHFEDTPEYILTKGMQGRIKAAQSRLEMRLAFWSEKRRTNEGILTLAKIYSLTTDKWVPVD
jgi:hypothetical protein